MVDIYTEYNLWLFCIVSRSNVIWGYTGYDYICQTLWFEMSCFTIRGWRSLFRNTVTALLVRAWLAYHWTSATFLYVFCIVHCNWKGAWFFGGRKTTHLNSFAKKWGNISVRYRHVNLWLYLFLMKIKTIWSGKACNIATSQLQRSLYHLCVQSYTCSPCVRSGFLQVLGFPSVSQKWQ